MNCFCEQFHPNVETNIEKGLLLTNKEVSDLTDYFYKDAGYISYEHSRAIHAIIKKLMEHYANSTKTTERKE